MPIVPNREELLLEVNAAVQELLSKNLTNPNLDKGWYSQIGDSQFDACYDALEDACHPDAHKGFAGSPYAVSKYARMHVVAAPVGSGKTSHSLAFIVGMVRYAERHPDAPYGCLFVADQMQRADQVYRDLDALIPGKVAIWTTEHDPNCKVQDKVPQPAARYSKEQLRDHPVAVVTHKFFAEGGSHHAKFVTYESVTNRRALTVIDEHIEEVPIFEAKLSDVDHVIELMEQDGDSADFVPHVEALREFMDQRRKAPGTLDTPAINPDAWKGTKDLHWFASEQAGAYAKANGNDVAVQAVFGFAKALAKGRAFINRQHGTHYIGYASNIVAAPGTVLLDATSDVDGLSQLCPWREHQEVPHAHYSNLHIVHVQPTHKAKNLTSHLKSAKRKREYVKEMVATIKAQMQPGQKGLVVVKKLLIDNEYVPNWPIGDPRHSDPKLFTEDWAWEIDGRKLCAVHWGTGIGQNKWKDADVVFLFDDFALPRRVVIATAQGIQGHKATEGALASMRAHNSKSQAVDILQNGHVFRWMKQMALRGKARNYDEQGHCYPQKLVYCGNHKDFLMHAEDLFPGALVEQVKRSDAKQTQKETFFSILSQPNLPNRLDHAWLGRQFGCDWRDVSKNIFRDKAILRKIESMGWTLVRGKGKRASYLERIETTTSMALAA